MLNKFDLIGSLNFGGEWLLLDRTRIESRRVDGELERRLVVAARVAAVAIGLGGHVFRNVLTRQIAAGDEVEADGVLGHESGARRQHQVALEAEKVAELEWRFDCATSGAERVVVERAGGSGVVRLCRRDLGQVHDDLVGAGRQIHVHHVLGLDEDVARLGEVFVGRRSFLVGRQSSLLTWRQGHYWPLLVATLGFVSNQKKLKNSCTYFN